MENGALLQLLFKRVGSTQNIVIIDYMKEITSYDLRTDETIHQFLHEAYVKNESVLIPADMLKDFVEIGCRQSIAKISPFNK